MSTDHATAGHALAQAGRALHESARTHKRMAAHHRREARRLMQALEVMRAELALHGIRLVIDSEDGGRHGSQER